jgi:hypothetical protein
MKGRMPERIVAVNVHAFRTGRSLLSPVEPGPASL